MFGQLSHELEANVPASFAWELYGTLKLARFVEEQLSQILEKIDLIEGTPGLSSYKEKFVKVDNEKFVKETEVVEGGYLDLGFTLYRVRFEVIEKDDDCCILKSTIEYDVKEEAAANASIVTIEPLAHLAEGAKNYLIKNKTKD